MRAQRQTPIDTHYSPFPLTIELAHDGWRDGGLKNPEIREAPPETARAIKAVTAALVDVLTACTPKEPFFFHTLSLASSTEKLAVSYVGTGQHFPWIRAADMGGIGTKHAALHHLSQLPPEWATRLVASLRTHTTSGG